jgi:predicted alpha/beta hydrolase family esterase
MKSQIVFIHGGDTFDTYEEYLKFLKEFEVDPEYFNQKKWKDSLKDDLGNDFDIIAPQMPNKSNAKYLEWKIWFEKFIPFIKDEVIFIGHSLGGLFIAKYLSENILPRKIKAIFLVAAPFGDNLPEYTLGDFKLPNSLDKFREQGGNIYLYHSKDDYVVPFSDLEGYTSQLPMAKTNVFDDRGHFTQEKFPEIVDDIRKFR